MEFYAAYTDYQWLMDFTESCIREVTQLVSGSEKIEYQGKIIDFSIPFDRLTLVEAITKYSKEFSDKDLNDKEFKHNALKKVGRYQ